MINGKQLTNSKPLTISLLLAVVTAVGLLTLVESAQAAFPGDNGKIVFECNGGICAMNSDGSNPTYLTREGYVPVWSPDGEQVAFMDYQDDGYEVYIMNADGTGRTKLTDNTASKNAPTFSPDGEQLAFSSNRDGNSEIYVMNADGTGQTRLTNDPAGDIQPSFSPDGERLAFTSYRDGDPEIYVMNADGTGQTRLTDILEDARDAAWSPDGEQIAFSSQRHESQGSAGQYGFDYSSIYTISADGTGLKNLSSSGFEFEGDPSWSPDGTKIVYMEGQYQGFGGPSSYSISVMDADGSEPRSLTGTFLNKNPDWGSAPDSLPDTTPPDTAIDFGPSEDAPSGTLTHFYYSSSEPFSTFECSLDSAPFANECGSGYYFNLSDGKHTFEARATDKAGNVDPTPAKRTFAVDATAPTVSSAKPKDQAKKVDIRANIKATFSEAMNPETMEYAIALSEEDSQYTVPAKVTYDPETNKAKLDPEVTLKAGVTYVVTVHGGTDKWWAAEDLVGNTVVEKSWSFTTARTPRR